MLKPSLQLKVGQTLTMTPQLQQAIRLLQLPVLDLSAQIKDALEENIMLEAEDLPDLPNTGTESATKIETIKAADSWQSSSMDHIQDGYWNSDSLPRNDFADTSGQTRKSAVKGLSGPNERGSEKSLQKQQFQENTMQLDITGHHIEVTDPLRNYVVSKLQKIERHFDLVSDVHCILTVEKLRHKAEATISANGAKLYADATEEDMYAAIDALSNKLERRVRKHKEKLVDHHARDSLKRTYG